MYSIFRSWCSAFCWQLPLPDLIAKNDPVSLLLILNRFKFMNGKKPEKSGKTQWFSMLIAAQLVA